jgi:hypothetical protein
VTESYERRPHDPSDIRGGGGPAGAPDSWPTSSPKWGPLREGEPQVIYPSSPGHEAEPEPIPESEAQTEAMPPDPDDRQAF